MQPCEVCSELDAIWLDKFQIAKPLKIKAIQAWFLLRKTGDESWEEKRNEWETQTDSAETILRLYPSVS